MVNFQDFSFDDFYRSWHPKIRAYASRRGFQSAALDDMVQEIFIRLWQRLDAFDSERGSLGSYVWNQARYEVLDQFRRDAQEVRFSSFLQVYELPTSAVRSTSIYLDSQDEESQDVPTVEGSGLSVVECNAALEATHKSILLLPNRARRICLPTFEAVVHRAAMGDDAILTGLGADLGITRQAAARRMHTLLRLPAMQELRTDLRS